MKPTWRYCFLLFHSNDLKPKWNHQIARSRAKTRPKQSQTCVKYRGNVIFIERNIDVNTSDLKILYKKMSKYGWFSRCYLQFLQNFHVVCLQPNDWLESYDRYVSFGKIFWRLLIVNPMLWLLSSRNTLSVTLSDTAS